MKVARLPKTRIATATDRHYDEINKENVVEKKLRCTVVLSEEMFDMMKKQGDEYYTKYLAHKLATQIKDAIKNGDWGVDEKADIFTLDSLQ